jgi:hypothetical protein
MGERTSDAVVSLRMTDGSETREAAEGPPGSARIWCIS